MSHDPICPVEAKHLTEVVYREGFRQGKVNALNDASAAVANILRLSEAINDPGMFSDGSGRADPIERAYHRGLRDAIAALETLGVDR